MTKKSVSIVTLRWNCHRQDCLSGRETVWTVDWRWGETRLTDTATGWSVFPKIGRASETRNEPPCSTLYTSVRWEIQEEGKGWSLYYLYGLSLYTYRSSLFILLSFIFQVSKFTPSRLDEMWRTGGVSEQWLTKEWWLTRHSSERGSWTTVPPIELNLPLDLFFLFRHFLRSLVLSGTKFRTTIQSPF